MHKKVSVDVTLCTFRRPMVRETLASLDRQVLPDGVSVRVIVADNDETPSGQAAVEAAAAEMRLPVTYVHAPARNISIARNAGLEAATADWVAFLDDDEMAEPDWLARLLRHAQMTGADVVFGPAVADYGPDAPSWMRQQDHHSNRPVRKNGAVEIGFTCNALARWAGTPWMAERFALELGRTGGEDVDFFFRLKRHGATFEADDDAIVREPVDPKRLRLGWLMRRKFNAGAGHASKARTVSERVTLGGAALAKALFCGGGMILGAFSEGRRNFWMLRGALHLGVITGCFHVQPNDIYGK